MRRGLLPQLFIRPNKLIRVHLPPKLLVMRIVDMDHPLVLFMPRMMRSLVRAHPLLMIGVMVSQLVLVMGMVEVAVFFSA
jgi:hypothetical protein